MTRRIFLFRGTLSSQSRQERSPNIISSWRQPCTQESAVSAQRPELSLVQSADTQNLWFSFSLQHGQILNLKKKSVLKPILCLDVQNLTVISKNLCCNCYSNNLPTGSHILTINLSPQNKALPSTVTSQLHCSEPSVCLVPFKLPFWWWILELCSL